MISYARLVDLAFASHNPTYAPPRGQYASLVLAHDEEQLAVARDRAGRVSEAMGGRALSTRIELLSQFWPAEDYHQDYYNRNPKQSYCAFVITPKIEKFRKVFAERLKK